MSSCLFLQTLTDYICFTYSKIAVVQKNNGASHFGLRSSTINLSEFKSTPPNSQCQLDTKWLIHNMIFALSTIKLLVWEVLIDRNHNYFDLLIKL